MKKVLLFCLLFLTITVNAQDKLKMNTIRKGGNKDIQLLFTICDPDDTNCVNIDEISIEDDDVYDNFEVKNGVVYLKDANISLGIYSTGLIFNIEGTNRIKRLVNTTNNGVANGEGYIPFKIFGDGTLEIESYDKYNKNEDGEIYYKYWGESDGLRSVYYVKCELSEDEISKCSLPESGWTLSSIANDIDYEMKSDETNMFIIALNDDTTIDQLLDGSQIKEYIHILEVFPKYIESYTNENGILPESAKEVIGYYISNDIIHGYNRRIFASHPMTTTTDVDMDNCGESVITELPKAINKKGNLFIGEEPIEYVNIIQSDDVIFESKDGINSKYTLKVENITQTATEKETETIENKTKKALLKLFDINVLDEDKELVKMENGKYTVRIKVDDLLEKYENLSIIYLDNESKVEELKSTIKDNSIEFTTTHLSKYGIIGTSITTTKTEDTNKEKSGNIITNPKTADSLYINIVGFISLIFIIIVASLKLKKIRA